MIISVFNTLWGKGADFFKERDWFRISLMLCVVGFLKEFRPSEAFIYEYLIGDWRNLTTTEVSQIVLPSCSYSLLAMQLLILIITDITRYKFVIIMMGIFGIVSWSITIWTTTLFELMFMAVSSDISFALVKKCFVNNRFVPIMFIK